METLSGLLFAKYNANLPSDFSNIPIWYNSFVRIDNKPIYYKNQYKAGIQFQNDLLDENFRFLTFDALKENNFCPN